MSSRIAVGSRARAHGKFQSDVADAGDAIDLIGELPGRRVRKDSTLTVTNFDREIIAADPEDGPAAAPENSIHPLPAPTPASAQLSVDEGDVTPRDVQPAAIALSAIADLIDNLLRARMADVFCGLSPAALTAAYMDWCVHLAGLPGRRLQLMEKAANSSIRFAEYLQCRALRLDGAAHRIEPQPQDRRFADPGWREWPYDGLEQTFLRGEQWWRDVTTGVRGVTKQHENVVEFMSRQILDMASPSNFVATNPVVLNSTLRNGGANLLGGLANLAEDWRRRVQGERPAGSEKFVVGRDVAVTPGKVVYRNRLIELIQYGASTDEVRPEPILIVPAWIMKYYILDLSPENSLVRALVDSGHTVFMISWKNPDRDDCDLAMDDYRKLGVMAALDAVSAIIPGQNVHAVGYCIGGTLLSIAAAAMSRDGDDRLRSVTLFASQTDFTEAGELMLFVNESQLTFLEDMMREQGFLDGRQMAGAFQMLRSNDLVWSYVMNNYLLGVREPMTDLMAWNSDLTRMPYRMHAEYLRSLFLNNDLAEGRFKAAGRPVALSDIRTPIFAVGTTRDHVAPWRSTFKIQLSTEAEVTYLLTTGGHNAGIISEPGHRNRSYQVRTKKLGDTYLAPDAWLAEAPHKEGSWWPQWIAWLDARSSAPAAARDSAGEYAPIGDAPGTYVMAT